MTFKSCYDSSKSNWKQPWIVKIPRVGYEIRKIFVQTNKICAKMGLSKSIFSLKNMWIVWIFFSMKQYEFRSTLDTFWSNVFLLKDALFHGLILHQLKKYNSFCWVCQEYVDFWTIIYLILYPSLGNLTTHITFEPEAKK